MSGILLLLLLVAAGRESSTEAQRTMRLIAAHPLHELLPGADSTRRLEASGVVSTGRSLLVVFDNLNELAEIFLPVGEALQRNQFHPLGRADDSDFEGIARDDQHGFIYLLTESKKRKKGRYARITVLDASYRQVDRDWVRLDFARGKKGYEGIAVVRKNEQTLLLVLRETPDGREADSSGTPGIIDVLQKEGKDWRVKASFSLPDTVRFRDYAGLDLQGDQLLVVSQESAAVFRGVLDVNRWQVVQGGVFRLPDLQGKICRAEGICWLTGEQVAVVTDQSDPREEACHPLDMHLLILSFPPSE